MAAAQTNAKLMAIIAQLQVQVAALQKAAPAAAAAPLAGAAPVVFTDTPQTLSADDLISYSTKRGSAIFKQGCKALDDKALTNGFAMTPNKNVIFVKAFRQCATAMGWNQGIRQITMFTNSARGQVDIIKSYGRINKATLKTASERFCKPGEPDSHVGRNRSFSLAALPISLYRGYT
jgi:hypothetical protein